MTWKYHAERYEYMQCMTAYTLALHWRCCSGKLESIDLYMIRSTSTRIYQQHHMRFPITYILESFDGQSV